MQFKRIYVEITNECNLNCHFCLKTKRPPKMMTIEEFKKVIGEIKPYTNTIYLHIKGEPLIHKDLNEFLTICDKENITVKITTNGTLLKEKYEILKNHRCLTQINISLHANIKENRKHYCEEIFKVSEELSENKTIIYRLWTLNNLKLDEESTTIVETLKKYYELDNNIVEKIITSKNIKIKPNIYVDKDNEFNWPSLNNKMNSKTGICYGTKTHIGILSDGTVVPCCLDDGVINLGNIFKTPLKEILNTKRFISMNENMKKCIFTEELCQKCSFYDKI